MATGSEGTWTAPSVFGSANDVHADPVRATECLRCCSRLLEPIACRPSLRSAVTAGGLCSNNTGFRVSALCAAYVMMGCQTPGAEVLLPNG